MSTDTRQRPQVGYPTLAVGFLTLMVLGTDLFVVSPLLAPISAEYRVSPGTAGIAVTAFSLAYVACAPWLGAQADRIGRRKLLVVGLACFATANLLTGLAPGFAVLVVSRVLAGMSAAAVTPSVYALTGQFAPPERRGGWLAIVGAGLLIALATGAPAGTLVASATRWNVVFIAIAVLAAVLAVVNRRAWPRPTASAAAAQEKAGTVTKIRAASVTALWGMSVYIVYTYLPTGLREVAGFSVGLVAAALVVYGVGAVAGSLGGGRLADRQGPARVAAVSLVGLAVLQFLLNLLLPVHAVLLVALGLFALAGYACFPAHQSRLVANFPRQSASVLAWNNSALYVGISAGAALGGALLSTGFWLLPVVGGATAILAALVSRYWAIAPRPAQAATGSAEADAVGVDSRAAVD